MKHCNKNCEYIEKCYSTDSLWYICVGQKNSPKVEFGDECSAYNENEESKK